MESNEQRTSAPSLPAWQASMVEVFVRAAALVGLPRSIGEIYGILFCAERALTFDDLVARLGISRGSVSQGLKLLRQLGAVKPHYVAGSRKDHYQPELSMQRLASGFVRDQFTPHLESGAARLQQVEAQLATETDPQLREHAAQRLNTLLTWQRRAQKLMPVVMAVLSGSQLFQSEVSAGEEII